MVELVKGYDAQKLRGVSRAFTHFLALANSAEAHHRVRRLREWLFENHSPAALSSKSDSVLGTIRSLIKEKNMTAEEIVSALTKQKVEIVLTGWLSYC